MASINLKANQSAAISLLVAGRSAKVVAEVIGVTPETISRWRNNDPTFMAAMNAAQAELHNESRDQLRSLLNKALEALSASLSDSSPTRVRLDAAKFLFEFLAMARPGHLAVGPDDPTSVKSRKEIEQDAEIAKIAQPIGAL